MYAILDIETTGGKYNEEGITEIAIYKFDGHEIVDQFISLINPEKPIQPFVVKLTGINNEMLRNAPKFYEVAKRIVEITEDCIIVAHNAGFDYRILKTEFDRLGYPYERKSLCTVELAEKLLPEQKSYSLGKLVRSLGIPMSERHRASGDALATVQLFKLLLAKDIKKEIISETVKVNSKKQVEDRLLRLIDPIPSQTGVYYFHREDGKIIYIGKSRNIRKKITQHFTNQNNKSVRIQEEVHYINYELTGNDLIAQLKEYIEVKKNKPKFNRHTRKPVFEYGLEEVVNDKGYIRLVVSRIKRNQKFITSFSNIQQAKSWMSRWAEKYGLCIDLVDSKLPIPTCHHTPEIHCNGTCFLKEPAEVYNNRAKDLINEQSLYNKNQMIIDKGRTSGEQSIVLLEGGELKGFGFFTLNHQIQNKEIFKSILTPLKHNADAKHIIQNYLRQQKNIKVVDL